ncbi:hypothetical protein ONZ45_g5351 [Pleurotus djamor]|nr:hypothetical protein ONZ45_g5351 [Pleurotus djamor]
MADELIPNRHNLAKRYYFARPILPEDWRRFEKYAVKVRKLRVAFDDLPAYEKILRDMMFYRLRIDWLPNLQTLTCSIRNDVIVQLFAQRSVTTLHLESFNRGATPLSVLHYLPARMPALQRLSINGTLTWLDLASNHGILVALRTVLSSWNELIYITLPHTLASPIVSNCLSMLPALTTIHVLPQKHILPRDAGFFDEKLPPESFPSLLDLSISIPLPTAVAQMSSESRYNKLSRLALTADASLLILHEPAQYGTINDVGKLVQAISTSCPMLDDLTLELTAGFHAMRQDNTEVHPKFQVIFTPLTTFQHLKALCLQYDWEICTSKEDVLWFMSSLPHLNILYLMGPHSPQLHLSVLSSISAIYPSKLKELGLRLRIKAEQIPNQEEGISFTGLKKLSLATSEVVDHLAVAEYLSLLLCEDCDLDSMGGTWDTVKSYLPALWRMFRHGERRARSSTSSQGTRVIG